MSNKDWLSEFNYKAIINLLETAASTLREGQDVENTPLEKYKVKNMVNKLTEQLNLLIEEEK